MRRCLIVGNQTLGGAHLVEVVQQRLAAGEHEFYVVVPARPLHDASAGITDSTVVAPSPRDQAYAVARRRLEAALTRLQALGATAGGEVGDPDVMVAVRTALGRFEADEIVVSTLRRGLSTWLHSDVPARIGRSSGLPVTQLTGQATDRCGHSLHPVASLQPENPPDAPHGPA
jgi:nucleotide-binding universal stress UspA family protein